MSYIWIYIWSIALSFFFYVLIPMITMDEVVIRITKHGEPVHYLWIVTIFFIPVFNTIIAIWEMKMIISFLRRE